MNYATNKFFALLATVLCSSPVIAGDPVTSDDSITIYSRMQPGAVSPEMYRPVAGRQ